MESNGEQWRAEKSREEQRRAEQSRAMERRVVQAITTHHHHHHERPIGVSPATAAPFPPSLPRIIP